ncbi:hypothetical protein ACLOJK_024810 [Asimina triloba]
MALAGLFPVVDLRPTVKKNYELKYPKMTDMLDYICKQQPKLLNSTKIREEKLLFPSKVSISMINFLLKCFESDIEQDASVVGMPEFHSSVGTLCLLLEHAMAYEGSAELHATASKGLISIGSHFPEMMASRYAERISWLKQLLGHVDSETRESAARLFGIACSALSSSAASVLISELVPMVTGASVGGAPKIRFESQHGALSAIGYVVAQCMTGTPTIGEPLLQSTINHLVNAVKSESPTLSSIAMEALGHIGLQAQLPALDHDSVSTGILTILHERLGKLLLAEDIKVIQKIVIGLGHMSLKETSFSLLKEALDLIFSLCRSKIEDVLFAAGEALSFIWGGVPVTADLLLKSNYTSLSLSSNYLTGDAPSVLRSNSLEDNDSSDKPHSMVRDVIAKKLFDDLLYSSRKEERCAGTVWLLSLVMFCGHHPKIQQMLPEIQEAFSHLLGEQNDLTQELASQGMSIIYELGDESMKSNLVNALVSTLTGSGKRKRAVKLMEDSEVFQEGAIGESLSGGKLSTYKELCSLSNEMGQPDLIYKFMDLANYQASLNSKRGAAFGFSKIAKQAGDALQPHLRMLVPRLVRYQYDPDKNVQDAMGHIWKSLVEDPKKTMDEYLDLIFEDLLVQCGSRLWRSREASCLALADIIQGRRFSQVSEYLKRIWIAAFRAMDDIKETVRNAGDGLCRAVSSLTIRLCDVSLTPVSDASKTMDIVLPFLLSEGIVSKVATIQKASISIVMKLSKVPFEHWTQLHDASPGPEVRAYRTYVIKATLCSGGAGVAIRPHLPDLVCCMLESLSSLEDQRLNYVETEKLENLRIAVAKDSPMWETLDLCLKVVDTQSLDLLVPRLSQLVRSGVGLNTRVGVASFISLLVQKVGADIKPFTTILLKLLFSAVQNEKSGSAKRAFSAACAIVLKFEGDKDARALFEELFEGDKDVRALFEELWEENSSSVFEGDKDVRALFEELWEENSSSERVTLQLYMSEIVSLLCDGIASSSWDSKRKSAKAIKKMSEVLGESLSSSHNQLLQCLLREMPGRLWELQLFVQENYDDGVDKALLANKLFGKDAVLYAIAAICTACHKAISVEDPALPNSVLSAISAACTKKVRSYREAAFSCLREIIEAFGNPEFFGMVFQQLFEAVSSATKIVNVPSTSDAKAGDDTNEDDVSAPLDKILDCFSACINVAHLHDILQHEMDLISVSLRALSPVKMSAFSLVKELCLKFQSVAGDPQHLSEVMDVTSLIHKLFHSVAPKVVDCLSTVKIAQACFLTLPLVHVAASECLLEMTKLYKAAPPVPREEVSFKDELIYQCTEKPPTICYSDHPLGFNYHEECTFHASVMPAMGGYGTGICTVLLVEHTTGCLSSLDQWLTLAPASWDGPHMKIQSWPHQDQLTWHYSIQEMRRKKIRATPPNGDEACSSTTTTTPHLPDELILEILSGVPKNHLFNLNSVSKHWNNLISKYIAPTYGFFYSATTLQDFDEKEDTQLQYACLSRAMKPCIAAGSSSTVASALCLHTLTPPSSSKGFLLFASNGCQSETEEKDYFYVLNPFTNQSKQLPKLPHLIGFSCVSALVVHPPHYKVVRFSRPHDRMWKRIEVDVFSSQTGEWVKYSPRWSQQLEGICNERMVSTDSDRDASFWVYNDQYLHRWRIGESKIRGIELPGRPQSSESCIGECMGKLYLAMERDGLLKIWMLEDFDARVWVSKFEERIVGSSSSSVTNRPFDDELKVMTPWGFHPDLEVVFLQIGTKMAAYHFGIEVLEEVCVLENNCYIASVFPYSSCRVSLEDVCQKQGQQKEKCEWFSS